MENSLLLTPEQKDWYLENLVKKKDRIQTVWDVLDKLIVGEDENKKIIFYNFISSVLDHPNGTILMGEAAGGKTHIVREVLKLFPDEKKIIFGGASKKALIHRKPDIITAEHERHIILHNKILWFLEDKGSEESYDILRPILSRDQEEIRYELPTKKKIKKEGYEGEYFQNEVIVIKGCPSFITTSTKIEILPETGTRVFTLGVDESIEQSKKVLRFKSRKRQFLTQDPDFLPIQQYIQNLKQYKVWIPFADIITMGADNLNVRRDIDKIYALIEAHVIFNQVDRPILLMNGEEYLPAYLDDYFTIMDIALPIIKPTLYNIPKKILDFYDKIKSLSLITHKEIAMKTNYNQETARKYCWQLIEAGKLVKEKEGTINIYTPRESSENGSSVTNVTFGVVTPIMIHTSLESAIFTYSSTVTQITKSVSDIHALFTNIYTISVTGHTMSDFDITELVSIVDTVLREKVTLSHTTTCISCGGLSPPFILREGKCELCGGWKPTFPMENSKSSFQKEASG